MAKKKKSAKGKRDARGYGQQQPTRNQTTTTTAPVVSSQTHDGMKTLLGHMQGSMTSEKPVALTAPSDRFFSRLTTIVDRLTELGFATDPIDQVVTALHYNITMESALDWLCLHIPTLELPTLFTDGRLRDTLTTVTTNESITVVRFAKPPPSASGTSSEQERPMLEKAPSQADKAELAKQEADRLQKQREEEAANERKAWILQQYQYQEEDEQHDTQLQDVHIPEKPSEDSTNHAASSTVESTEEQATTPLSPDEVALAEYQKEVAEMEADLHCEANNYMRTKQEIKQLQRELKQKKNLVKTVLKRIEKARAKQAPADPPPSEALAPTDDLAQSRPEEPEGGGLFGMFDEDEEATGPTGTETPSIEAQPAEHKPVLLDGSIPKGWTGTTPKKTLEETLRKQKLPRPKFLRLPANGGYKLTVTLRKKGQSSTWQAYHSDFVEDSSLQDYLAMQALYQMDPTLPLYRMFPLSFRDQWLSWKSQVEDAKTQELQAEDEAKQNRIDYLMTLVEKNAPSGTANQSKNRSSTQREQETEDDRIERAVPENWEDEDSVEGAMTSNLPTPQGQRLRREFEQRQGRQDYQKMLKTRSALPMTSFRDQVLETVEKHPVTILCAETGAGKTTQCPQFLLEQALSEGRGDKAQILVTQPRRVAATSVAERVSEELCDRLGNLVGYQIRMEAKRSANTKLLFCTTGIVLRRLQEDRTLEKVTHILVDEVHERQQQTDVLLVALRQLQRTSRPDLKIILMSATLDSELFCSFFPGAPFLSIPGRTFPVSSYHLEDLLDATDHIVEEGSRYAIRGDRNKSKGDQAALWVTGRGGEKHREVVDLVPQTNVQDVSDDYPGYKWATRKSMDRVNEEVINYDLIEDVLDLILCRPEHNHTLLVSDGVDLSTGSILVFLPGLGEIRSLTERLEGSRTFANKGRFEIIPMHSTLSSQDQRRAFVPAKRGCRKIILSTNIAETSVTIPDVVCVIDTGRVREVRRNKRTSTSVLVMDWCSKASAKQRAGRAGRVQPGLCLKLYSSYTATRVMKAASEPELRRVPLEEICLSILASGLATSCMDFLSQAPQPPTDDSVLAAVGVLTEVGAIQADETSSKKRVERLTPLGQHLSKLPVDVRLGKMIIFGALFRCVDKVLTIAAGLSSQSPFSTFVADASVAKAKQQAFADEDSDFLTLCNVWDSYAVASKQSRSAGRKFCHANYLNHVALREMGDARRQFADLLGNIGFLDGLKGRGNSVLEGLSGSTFNENGSNRELVHAVICAGLYPNVAHLETTPAGDFTVFHKTEQLYFHNSSVNARKKKRFSDGWVAFHEKFGTQHRVSVSTTCFVHPFALLLFGGSVTVQHADRSVIVDDWIQIGMAAQVGVIMKELRKQMDLLLAKMIEQASPSETESLGNTMIHGIVDLLSS